MISARRGAPLRFPFAQRLVLRAHDFPDSRCIGPIGLRRTEGVLKRISMTGRTTCTRTVTIVINWLCVGIAETGPAVSSSKTFILKRDSKGLCQRQLSRREGA